MNAETAFYMRQEYGLHTCGHCQLVLIDLKDLQNTTTPAGQNHVNDLCRISISGPQVFAAANDGCPFFLFCTQNINCPPGKSQEFKFALPSTEMADSLALVIRVRKAAGAGGPNVCCLIAWDRYDKHPMHPIFYQHLSWIFSLHVPKEDPGSDLIFQRVVDPNAGSDANIDFARRWFNECLDSHDNCKSQTFTSLPSRLLDVGSGKCSQEYLRLVSTDDVKAKPWITLSYCWGGPQPIQTTKANIQDHMSNIPFRLLPATLQDAIVVTRQLGGRYLWIDALCIIQDDDDDKAREIHAIPSIYQGSILTISAACSSSCQQGFLYTRMPYPPGVVLPTLCPGNVAGAAQAISMGDKRSFAEPIHSRGWTYQEHVLSTRILQYETTEIKWTCPSRRCDAGHENTEWRVPLASEFPDSNEKSEASLYAKWTNHVENYSGRRLTIPGDRLIAFSAIASKFAEHCEVGPSEYLAGLWKRTLIPYLLWRVSDPGGEYFVWDKKSSSWIAPSWSWGSVLGEVSWLLMDTELEGENGIRAIAKVLSSGTTPANINAPFAAVRDGRLTVKGFVTKAVLHLATSSVIESCHPASLSKFPLKVHLDIADFGLESNTEEQITVWCLELCMRFREERISGYPSSWTEYRYGLLLRSAAATEGQGSEFHRIGCYSQAISLGESKSNVVEFEATCDRCVETGAQTAEMVIEIV